MRYKKDYKKGPALYFLRGKTKTNSKGIRKGAGFTLIELLVVVFIIGVISSILVTNWRRNEQQYKLQRTAQQIIQDIREAQNMALSSTKLYNENSGLWEIPAGGYALYFNRQVASNKSYTIYADFNGNNAPGAGETIEVKELEGGIVIDYLYYPQGAAPNSVDILFDPPEALVSLEPPIPPATAVFITIRKEGATCSNNCRQGVTCSVDKDCRAIEVIRAGRIGIIE